MATAKSRFRFLPSVPLLAHLVLLGSPPASLFLLVLLFHFGLFLIRLSSDSGRLNGKSDIQVGLSAELGTTFA